MHKLPTLQKQFAIELLAQGLSHSQVSEALMEQFGSTLNKKQLSNLKARNKREYSDAGITEAKALRQAYLEGRLPFLSVTARLIKLSEIIIEASEGFPEMRLAPKGDVIELKKKDLGVAVRALELFNNVAEKLAPNVDQVNAFNLHIGLTQPNIEEGDSSDQPDA